jgi:hypothetical protein
MMGSELRDIIRKFEQHLTIMIGPLQALAHAARPMSHNILLTALLPLSLHCEKQLHTINFPRRAPEDHSTHSKDMAPHALSCTLTPPYTTPQGFLGYFTMQSVSP